MAFEMIEKYRIYICQSGDTKKTTEIEEGSMLFETDTGKRYIFNATSWVEFPEMVNLTTGAKVKITGGTNEADVIPTNGSYGLVTIEPNHISTANSTFDLLGIDGVFTGTGEDITNYAIMFINVYSDIASATDGLCIQTSHNNIDWYTSECYTIEANRYKLFAHQCSSKYFRIAYTNGGVAQTNFHLEVKLCTKNALASSHKIADSISEQDDASLNKSVLTAQQPDLTFVNINATESGNLKVTDAENTLAIAKGQVIGSDDINKWGNAPDFDTADGEVTIWDGAEDATGWEKMVYTYPSTASIDSISSTDASDTNTVTIEGLDSNFEEVSQQVTLNGQTRVALSTSLIRFYRGYNDNGTKFAGHIIIYDNDTTTGGIPDDTTLIRGVIHPNEQQTEMAIYTIPAGKTGYLLGGYCSTAGANKTSNYVIKFKIRTFGGVFRTQQKVALSDTGTTFIPFTYPVPQTLAEKTDVEVTAQMTATGGTGASISAGFSIILVDN